MRRGGDWNSFWANPWQSIEHEFVDPNSYLHRGAKVAKGAYDIAKMFGGARTGPKMGSPYLSGSDRAFAGLSATAARARSRPFGARDMPPPMAGVPMAGVPRRTQPPQLAAYQARRAAERAAAAAAPQYYMHHSGYDETTGYPRPPRQGKVKPPRAPRGPPSAKQAARRAFIKANPRALLETDGYQMWSSHRRASKARGEPFSQTLATWRAQTGKGPKAKRIDEYSRYQALALRGQPFDWHRVAPGVPRPSKTGSLYQKGKRMGTPVMVYPRAHSLSYQGEGQSRPYGSVWTGADGRLHGSGDGMGSGMAY